MAGISVATMGKGDRVGIRRVAVAVGRIVADEVTVGFRAVSVANGVNDGGGLRVACAVGVTIVASVAAGVVGVATTKVRAGRGVANCWVPRSVSSWQRRSTINPPLAARPVSNWRREMLLMTVPSLFETAETVLV